MVLLSDRFRRLEALTSVAVLFLGVLCFGTASVLLGQDSNWDLRNYHLYNGYAYLTGRYDRDVGAAQIQTYLTPAADAAAYLLLAHMPPRAFGFLMGAVQGLNLWLTYLIARTIFSGFSRAQGMLAAAMCATAGACGAAGLSELGTLFHDVTTASFALVSLLLSLRYYFPAPDQVRRYSRTLLLSGLALGVGVGLKYTVAVYGIGLALAIISIRRAWKSNLLDLVRWGAAAFGGLLLSAGHWMYVLQRRFGSPLFPFYNTIFQSPYADISSFSDPRTMPPDVWTHLQYPFLFTLDHSLGMELPFQDMRFAVVFLSVGLVLILFGIQRALKLDGLVHGTAAIPGSARYLFTFFFVSYVLWQKQFGNYRYVQVLECLAPLVILLLLSALVDNRRQLLAIAALPLAVILVTIRAPDWGRVPWGSKFIDVSVPTIPRPARTTVLMTSDHPTSYAIPAFPRETRFVRIESNFFQPALTTKLANSISTALRSDHDYYLFTPSSSLEPSQSLISVYDFELVDHSCRKLSSNLETQRDNPLMFCRLQHRRPSLDDAGKSPGSPSGRLTVSPNPLPVCKTGDVARAVVSWKAFGTARVELRITSPNGPLWTSGGPEGSARTDAWVTRGTTFYLQDAAHGAASDPKNTLARVIVNTREGECH